MEFLLKKFKPKGFKEGAQPVHDLSKEDFGRVNAMISSIDDFDIDAMVELVEKRKAAADRTMEINRILKSAMTDEDAGKYAEKENEIPDYVWQRFIYLKNARYISGGNFFPSVNNEGVSIQVRASDISAFNLSAFTQSINA